MGVRYAVIGSGMMGQEHIRNIALLPGAELVAVADPDDAMRNGAVATAQKAGLAAPKAYGDWRDMISAGGLDAVVIASPNDTHIHVVDALLETNLGLLLEKPSATNSADAFALARRAQNRAAPVWVAMEYRYMPPVARLMDEVRGGAAGTVRMVSIVEHRFPFLVKVGNWNRFAERTGGTMVEKCCHFFDLMRLVTGSEPVRLYASGGQDVNHLDETYDGRVPDIADNAFVIVDFENGIRAALDLCMFAEGAYWQEHLSVTGDAGKVEAFVPGPSRFWPGGEERTSEIVISPRADKAPVRAEVHVDEKLLAAGDHHGGTYFQHARFNQLLREGGTPEVTLHDGASAVAMGEAAERSMRTGEVVHF